MFIFIAIIPLFIMRGILIVNIRDRLYVERVENITEHGSELVNQIVNQNYFSGQNRDVINQQMSILASIYDGRVVIIGTDYTVVSDSYYRITGKTVISDEVIECLSGHQTWEYNEAFDMVELAIPIADADGQMLGAMLISSSTATKTAAYEHIRDVSLGVVAAIALVLSGVAFLSAKEFTKSFRELAKSIHHVAEGHFDDPVSLKGYTEIEQISTAFNSMLSQLKTLEDSRQEFVSNVSHELKTPITSMKVLAESLNMQPDAPKELYQEFMTDIVEEIDRENEIITDLLSLVKMDKTSGDLNISSVNINETVELILKRLRPIAGKRNIELVFESVRTVLADVDQVKITQAMTNLIENAIKYNVAGGWVKVTLDMDQEYFYVQVADSGIGIAPEYKDKIFERFYRVDKARSRETGGTGLGLAITKNIILMHNGKIKVKSKEEEGTVFSVRIPLHPAEDDIAGR